MQAHRPKRLVPVPAVSNPDRFRAQVRTLNFLPDGKDLLAPDASDL